MPLGLLRRLVTRLLLALVLLAVSSCGSRPSAAPPLPDGVYCQGSAARSPHPTKLVIIVGENQSVDKVAGSADTPVQGALAAPCGSLSNMHGETHGSEANYLALVSGGYPRWALCDYPPDDPRTGCPYGPAGHLTGPSLFGQLQDAYGDRGWRTYAQSMGHAGRSGPVTPVNCQRVDGVPYRTGDGASHFRYVARHNPAVYFGGLASCAGYDVPAGDVDRRAGAFATDAKRGGLPKVSLLIPDDQHNGHDTTVGSYDRFLASTLALLRSTADYRSGALQVIVTYDEGSVRGQGAKLGEDCTDPAQGDSRPACRIATYLVGRDVPHLTDPQFRTHYSLLRSVEQWARLPLLGHAQQATALDARLLPQPGSPALTAG